MKPDSNIKIKSGEPVDCEFGQYCIEEKTLMWSPWGIEMSYAPTIGLYKTVTEAKKQIKHLEQVI